MSSGRSRPAPTGTPATTLRPTASADLRRSRDQSRDPDGPGPDSRGISRCCRSAGHLSSTENGTPRCSIVGAGILDGPKLAAPLALRTRASRISPIFGGIRSIIVSSALARRLSNQMRNAHQNRRKPRRRGQDILARQTVAIRWDLTGTIRGAYSALRSIPPSRARTGPRAPDPALPQASAQTRVAAQRHAQIRARARWV